MTKHVGIQFMFVILKNLGILIDLKNIKNKMNTKLILKE